MKEKQESTLLGAECKDQRNPLRSSQSKASDIALKWGVATPASCPDLTVKISDVKTLCYTHCYCTSEDFKYCSRCCFVENA